MYEIVWQGEVIDAADCKLEAEYLRSQYQVAYRNPLVTIRVNKKKEQ